MTRCHEEEEELKTIINSLDTYGKRGLNYGDNDDILLMSEVLYILCLRLFESNHECCYRHYVIYWIKSKNCISKDEIKFQSINLYSYIFSQR